MDINVIYNMNYIHALRTAMGTKTVPTYTTLTLSYLKENLYKIIGKNKTIWKENLLDHKKDTLMITSCSGNAYGMALMIYLTYSKTYTPK